MIYACFFVRLHWFLLALDTLDNLYLVYWNFCEELYFTSANCWIIFHFSKNVNNHSIKYQFHPESPKLSTTCSGGNTNRRHPHAISYTIRGKRKNEQSRLHWKHKWLPPPRCLETGSFINFINFLSIQYNTFGTSWRPTHHELFHQ